MIHDESTIRLIPVHAVGAALRRAIFRFSLLGGAFYRWCTEPSTTQLARDSLIATEKNTAFARNVCYE